MGELKMDIKGCADTDKKQDVLRESKFHGHVITAVKEAYRRLHVMGAPASRPSDFYAEMLKPDSLMYKIRQRISAEQKAIETVEARKKFRAAKKFGKQVQAEKVKENLKKRKESKKDIEKWKAKR